MNKTEPLRAPGWFRDSAFQKMITTPEQDGEARAEQDLHREKVSAQAEAERYLAEMHMPADLRDWAKSHGIEALSELVWTNGFLQGWRTGLARGRSD